MSMGSSCGYSNQNYGSRFMKRLPTDLRPRSTSPNLPCIRDYRMGDGSRKIEVDPNYEHRYREMLMQTSAHPGWRQDPTYDMKKDRK